MHPSPFQLKFEIQSDFRYLPYLTRIFKGLKVRQAYPLTQILVEAYNNAVLHAHKKNCALWIGIEIERRKQKIRIRVIDRGLGLKRKVRKGDGGRWSTRGRGMELMRAHADAIFSKRRRGLHILEVLKNL